MFTKTDTSLTLVVSLRRTTKNGNVHMNAVFKTAGICIIFTLLFLLLTGFAAADEIYVNESNFRYIGSKNVEPDAQGTIKIWNLDCSYILTEDINMSNVIIDMGGTYSPIGTESNQFTGNFDGNGYTISNLYFSNDEMDCVGLFGYAENANFSNVSLKDVSVSGGNYVGGLLGFGMNVSIEGCSVENNGDAFVVHGNMAVGSLAGGIFESSVSNSYTKGNATGVQIIGSLIGGILFNSSVSDSYATGNAEGTGEYVGGFIGFVSDQCSISNSYATGDANGSNYVGGLLGVISKSSVSDSYAMGNATGRWTVGGFIGDMYDSFVSDSYAEGDAEGIEDCIGGFIGNMNNSSIFKSYSTGDANGRDYIGGFIGYMAYSSISDNYAEGNAKGTGDYIGSFVGYMAYSSVSNSYAAGNKEESSNVGSFAGNSVAVSAGTITDSFYIGGQDSGDLDNGFWVTSKKLMQISTFTVLANNSGYVSEPWSISSSPDPNSIWYISEGQDYPKFYWSYQLSAPSPGGSGGSGTGGATIVDSPTPPTQNDTSTQNNTTQNNTTQDNMSTQDNETQDNTSEKADTSTDSERDGSSSLFRWGLKVGLFIAVISGVIVGLYFNKSQ